jgi:hypothetical protein
MNYNVFTLTLILALLSSCSQFSKNEESRYPSQTNHKDTQIPNPKPASQGVIKGPQWTVRQVKDCRASFDNFVEEDMTLRYICVDPATEGTRSSFIALQYTAATGEPDALRKVIVCSSSSHAAVISQSNQLLTGISLLRLVRKHVSEDDELYLNMLSFQNRSTLQRISEFNCVDGNGNLLVD